METTTVEEEKISSLEELSFDEVNAILVHKWYLSEKKGYDVGMEYAKDDFFRNHAKAWRERKLKEDLHLQKEEIIKHKWFLSEKMGYDVGMTEAALDWIVKYAEHWRKRSGPYQERE